MNGNGSAPVALLLPERVLWPGSLRLGGLTENDIGISNVVFDSLDRCPPRAKNHTGPVTGNQQSTGNSPSSRSSSTRSQTSRIYIRSWETLITAPGKLRKSSRITGPDRGEKFRVGSSRIRTF